MNINYELTKIKGLYQFTVPTFKDDRGVFNRVYFKSGGMSILPDFAIEETFYSFSKAGVIRGMHFQLPPHDQYKIVYVIQGEIEDVVLDLRRGNNYGNYLDFNLSDTNHKAILIPPGVAHGFIARKDSTVGYLISKEHAPTHDYTINPLSFGYNWKLENPILSKKDLDGVEFSNYITPYV